MLHTTWRTRTPNLDTTTVLDTLRALAATAPDLDIATPPDQPQLAITWHRDLPPPQHTALSTIAAAIAYFTRSDTPCTATVTTDWTPSRHERWRSLESADVITDGGHVTAVLAPTPDMPINALHDEPATGNHLPKGSRLVAYQRLPTRTLITTVRFAVTEPVPLTHTVIYTDRLRAAALSALAATDETRTTTMLGGRAADGQMLADSGHTHYLPNAHDGLLTGITAWTPSGLSARETHALTSVTRLYGRDEAPEITVRATHTGDLADTCPELARPHATWQSVTPFVPVGHQKKNHDWEKYVNKEVARELRLRDQPENCRATILLDDCTQYHQHRPSKTSHDARPRPSRASLLRLEFDTPVPGPLTLGRQSHFGLGTFAPAPDTNRTRPA